jgi:alpha-mannosidase
MHDDRRLVEERLDRVLRERIRPAKYAASVPLALSVWHVPDEPVPIAEALAARYEPFTVGTAWGRPWSTSWFRATGTVPAEWAGRRVEAVFDLGFTGDWPGFQAEGLAHDLEGRPIKGIEPRNRYVPVANPSTGGERVGFLVEAASNPDVLAGGFAPTPLGDKATAGDAPLYTFRRADLAVLDEEVWHLTIDVDVLAGLMRELATDDPRRHEILRALERALDELDLTDVAATATAARRQLAGVLSRPATPARTWSTPSATRTSTAPGCGRLRETMRKSARTFANVTALATEYPEFRLRRSQAQQYAWVKERNPEIYRRIRTPLRRGSGCRSAAMGRGRRQPARRRGAGPAAVHASVLPREFGVECQGVWLPDSFGYTAPTRSSRGWPGCGGSSPRRSPGTRRTRSRTTRSGGRASTAPGSSRTSRRPTPTTARWRRRELAHAGAQLPGQGGRHPVAAAVRPRRRRRRPTREMVERSRRLRDLEGSPRVRIEHPDAFFNAAREEYPEPPVWSGELYWSCTAARTPRRRAPRGGGGRQPAQRAPAAARRSCGRRRPPSPRRAYPYEYPYHDLDRLWKTVAAAPVPRHPAGQLDRLGAPRGRGDVRAGARRAGDDRRGGGRRRDRLRGRRRARRRGRCTAGPVGAQHEPAAAHRGRDRAWVPWPAPSRPASAATATATPHAASGWRTATSPSSCRCRRPAPCGWSRRRRRHRCGGWWGGNKHWSGSGRGGWTTAWCASSWTTTGCSPRCATSSPAARCWRPAPAATCCSCTRTCRTTGTPGTSTGTTAGATPTSRPPTPSRSSRPGRWSARSASSGRSGSSTIVQTVRVTAGSRRVDVVTDLDWHEREKLLKAAFPLDVHADRTAAEIQFGHVQRATHTNTSWEAARFEVYAHRWVHVAEPGYGVAVVNDSTYGHDAGRTTRAGVGGGTTTTVRLSLVRAPRSPDPGADQGRHRMTYALLPGATVADAVAAGYALNLPLRVVPGGDAAPPAPLVSVEPVDGADAAGVTVEAVKLADDGSGDVVVRLYEALGGRSRALLRPSFPVAGAQVTDLLERPADDGSGGPGDLGVEADGGVPVALRPFQVLTVRLRR